MSTMESPHVADEQALVVQVHLEEAGAHSLRGALLGAAAGAGGGPVYRFVATAAGTTHTADDHVAAGVAFPLAAFQDLDEQTDDEAAARARRRLHELDLELAAEGWKRLPQVGQHWWSLRYER